MEVKEFQTKTAERVNYLFKNGQRRVLVADEVGLGKTIIASKVVSLIANEKKRRKKKLQVLYICSNVNIAKQNSRKINEGYDGNGSDVIKNRLSMQHRRIFEPEEGDASVRLIPLTPMTSFDLSSGSGYKEERALCYAVLSEHRKFTRIKDELKYILQVQETLNEWDGEINKALDTIGDGSRKVKYLNVMKKAISKKLKEEEYLTLLSEIKEVCKKGHKTEWKDRKKLSNGIRKMFAEISLDMLKPDLVIMDEFQRFRDLLDTKDKAETEEGMINARFLNDSRTRVLLLSATPYKPFSTFEEVASGEQSHEQDFMELMKFLIDNTRSYNEFKKIWEDYSNELIELRNNKTGAILRLKRRAERQLYERISRTERRSEGIMSEKKACEYPVDEGDFLSFIEAQTLISKLIGENMPIEYVKSAPYLLSFMNNYKIQQKMLEKLKKTNNSSDADQIRLSDYKELLLSRSEINHYKEIPCNNLRLRVLFDECFGKNRGSRHKDGAELLLWIPPSRPYYKTPDSIFSKNAGYSKTLVFSAWEMVPPYDRGADIL